MNNYNLNLFISYAVGTRRPDLIACFNFLGAYFLINRNLFIFSESAIINRDNPSLNILRFAKEDLGVKK